MSFDLKELHAALLEHFNESDLRALLRHELDKILEHISTGSGMKVVIQDVIETAERNGWLEKLIRVAAEARKDSPRLQAIRDAYDRHLKKSGTTARVAEPKRKAIRGLFPFEGDDVLPGETRRGEARVIATSIRSDDFRCSVVCGDSGCGKTSMLRTEVARTLHKEEFNVVYLRDPRRLVTAEAKGLAPADRLESALVELRKMLPSGGKVVLILDQFEDFFADYPAAEQRSRLGTFFSELTSAPSPTRVVCGLRSDAFLDFYKMGFPHPKHIVLRVKNLSLTEAEEIILECARDDGLEITPAFANTLASDLEADGFVRPPELQVVCRHLKGSLNEKRYQKLGRKTGILATHVKDSIKNCAVERTAARLLRTLCDFPRRRRGEAKSVEALAGEVEGREVSPAGTNTEVVQKVLSQFEQDQLVNHEDREGASRVYSLVHDYLVEAISRATDDISTRTEQANQLLRYYLSARDEVMPWRRMWLIRRHADRKLLAEPGARRLVRKRLVRPVLQAGAWAVVALLACCLYLLWTGGVMWEREEIGRAWDNGAYGYRVLARGGKVLTWTTKGSLKLWDGESGEQLNHLDLSKTVWIGPTEEIVVEALPSLSRYDPPNLVRINLAGGKATELPLSRTLDLGTELSFSSDGRFIAVAKRDGPEATITYYSLEDDKIVWTIRNDPKYTWISYSYMVLTAKLLVYPSDKGIRIHNVRDGSLIREMPLDLPSDWRADFLQLAVSPDESLIAVVQTRNEDCTVILCNVATGAEVRRRSFPRKKFGLPRHMRGRFTADGGTLSLLSLNSPLRNSVSSASYVGPLRLAVKVSDLTPVADVPWGQTIDVDSRNQDWIAWKINPNESRIWQVGAGTPQNLEGLELSRIEMLQMRPDGKRLLIRRFDHPLRLWDMEIGGSIEIPRPSMGLGYAEFTDDGEAISVKSLGGKSALFDGSTGKALIESLPGPELRSIIYNSTRQQVLMWNTDGQVIRYRRGRYFFGHFVPSAR